MTEQLPISTDFQRAKLTAHDFWTLADAGAFENFAKTELIEGEIWVVNSVWSWHARTTAYITTELSLALRQLGSDLTVFTSGSVDLTDDSVPEPDVFVGQDFAGRGLPLARLRIAVEVSDTTRDRDLGRKSRLYARAGVPEYWVVDREGRRIVRRWSPTQDGFANEDEHAFGETLTSATIDGLAIPTGGIRYD